MDFLINNVDQKRDALFYVDVDHNELLLLNGFFH